MPSDKDRAEEGTSAPAAGTSPVPEAEDPGSGCPSCQAARSSQGCPSSCTHCFCPPCIEEWSHSRFSCPYCQQPLHHPFPRQGVRCQERHHGHGPCPPRSGGRWAARRSYQHPSGQSRPGRGRGDVQARGAERGGRRRAGRRWQDEARRGWGQDVLASPRGSRRRWRPRWGSSGQRRAARSRSRSRRNRSRARGQHSRRHRRRQRRQSRHQDNAPAWHRPRSRQSHGRGQEMHARQARDPSARHRRQRSRRHQREEQAARQGGHRSRRHRSRPWRSPAEEGQAGAGAASRCRKVSRHRSPEGEQCVQDSQ